MTGRQWALAGGIVVLIGVVGLTALAASCAVIVRRQVEVRDGQDRATFERETAEVLARLGDLPVLIEETATGPRWSAGNFERRAASAGGRRPDALWVLVWADDEQKIVRVSVPLWLLRLSPTGVQINVNHVDLGKLRLSVADIERAGPGPLLMHEDGRSRVLVWTE